MRRIRTHVTEFNSQLVVFVLQSSEELKVNIFTLKLSKNISDMQIKKALCRQSMKCGQAGPVALPIPSLKAPPEP